MKNMYFINKANKLTNKIKFSVFEYNKMLSVISSEIDSLEESNDYYRKGFIELHDRIEEAIEYIKDSIIDFDFVNSEYPSRKNAIDIEINEEIIKDLVDILKGVDKE